MTKKPTPTDALVAVISALEPLTELDRQWVLQSAASRWSITLQLGNTNSGSSSGAASQGGSGSGPTGSAAEVALSRKDARAFVRHKNPKYDVQRVACLAYFHMKTTGQHGFSSKDIGKLHTDSGGPRINLTRALDNATRKSKYLSNRGPHEKQLTTLGEDIVEALPDQSAVTAREQSTHHARRGHGKRKTKKA